MNDYEILSVLNDRYPLHFTRAELLREGGNVTYAVYTNTTKYFLKIAGHAFADTIRTSIDVGLYLQSMGVSVPKVILTKDGKPYIEQNENLVILYEFLTLTEIDMKNDAEQVGDLLGRLHNAMSGYQGVLAQRDKAFYIDRYINILREKRYPKTEAFAEYGEALWRRVRDLPRGYTHGDLYCGNVARSADGTLYILDLDTSCVGFPMYDLALICNQTEYFRYDDMGLSKTLAVYKRLLPAYCRQRALTEYERNAICDMLALYHFALQATIIEIHGLDCVDDAFLDNQLAWLKRWERQCVDTANAIERLI